VESFDGLSHFLTFVHLYSSKLDDLEKATYLSQSLGDLETGKSTFEAEQEPGKLKRPPVFRWQKSPVHFTAITPKNPKEA
jgi:hypothetical protein